MMASLHLNEIELFVHLGWPEEERKQPQAVRVNIEVEFETPPDACETDQLEDSFCYAALIKKIQENTTNKQFRLIEHLGCDIYKLLKTILPSSQVRVKICKYPKLTGFSGPVYFTYGDPS